MRRVISAVCIAIVVAALAAAAATAGPLPPQSHPYGASYGEWQARWFQWIFGIPVADNPGLDETGEKCAVGQSGRVWFTAFAAHPGTTERSCTIPSGTALFVLAVSNECSNIEPPPFFGSTEAELRECAAAGFEVAFSGPVSITVDGRAVPDLRSYRTQTPVFTYTLPEDNLYGLPAGTTATAVSDGIFVMLSPLPVGEHEVVVHVESPVLGTLDEIYHITVVPRGRY
jgi:hypothetical protein